MAGIPGIFGCREDYESLVEDLGKTKSIRDEAAIHWDVRPSPQYDSLEFRLTDVCMRVDEAIMIAGLARALTRTCHAEAIREQPIIKPRPELLRSAKWRASRHGLNETLVDLAGRSSIPAVEMMTAFLGFLRTSLEEDGDWEEVSSLVEATIEGGTGASRQRKAYERAQRLEDVVDLIVSETRPA